MTLSELWARLPQRHKAWLYMLDRMANALFGGDPNETISERFARWRRQGRWVGREGCRILEAADPGHCKRIDEKEKGSI